MKNNEKNSKDQYAYIRFKINFDTAPDQRIKIVGDKPELGNWNPREAINLYTTNDLYPLWVTKERIKIKVGLNIDYKYLIFDDKDNYNWEYLPAEENRHVLINLPYKISIYNEKENAFEKIKIDESIEDNKHSSNSHSNRKYSLADICEYDNKIISHFNFNIIDHFLDKGKVEYTNKDRIIFASSFLPVKVKKVDNDYKIELIDQKFIYMCLYNLGIKSKCKIEFVGILYNYNEFDEDELDEIEELLSTHHLYMVNSSKEDISNYLAYVNEILCPVFINSSINCNIDDSKFSDNQYFKAYHKINRDFANKIFGIQTTNDYIVLNDINLALVPSSLYPKRININMGIYFHMPFPSSDIFLNISHHKELLLNILLCDVIGFQVSISASMFLSIVSIELGIKQEISSKGICYLSMSGRITVIHISCCGIDCEYLNQLLNDNEYKLLLNKYENICNNKFVFSSIDHVFEIYQIIINLESYKEFLINHSTQKNEFIFIQILNTSAERSYNNSYIEIINKYVNDIKSTFGDESIYFELYEGDKFNIYNQLALQKVTNVYFYLQSWKGLSSLVSQFIYMHKDSNNYGLIVNESSDINPKIKTAIRINPYNIEKIISSVNLIYNNYKTFDLTHYIKNDVNTLIKRDTLYWLKYYIEDLKFVSNIQGKENKKGYGCGLNYKIMKLNYNFKCLKDSKVYQAYRDSSSRLIFLDYENTLQSNINENDGLNSDSIKPKKELIHILNQLLDDPGNMIYIITGRQKDILEKWFKDCEKIGLCAEYGFYYKECLNEYINKLDEYNNEFKSWNKEYNWKWKEIVINIIKKYVEKTEGSYLIEKDASIVWNYKESDINFAEINANLLYKFLHNLIPNFQIDVVRGKFYLEVKPKNINKGYFISKILRNYINKGIYPDFIMAMGDDTSDEDMFNYLNILSKNTLDKNIDMHIYSCVVDYKPSAASYYLNNTSEVINFLESLTFKINNKFEECSSNSRTLKY